MGVTRHDCNLALPGGLICSTQRFVITFDQQAQVSFVHAVMINRALLRLFHCGVRLKNDESC